MCCNFEKDVHNLPVPSKLLSGCTCILYSNILLTPKRSDNFKFDYISKATSTVKS